MENRKVNILGTEYEIRYGFQDKEADGETRFYQKTIDMRCVKDMLDECSTNEEKRERFEEVFRHEIFHSFLFETGNDEYARDENLINVLAILSPKIFKVFQELDIL